MREPRRWDVFCRVVDNFGDAGVCWRLSQLLAHEHGGRVRLVIDDVRTLSRLEPAVRETPRQTVAAVEIVRWTDDIDLVPDGVDVIVDAFGCGPPRPYLERAASSDERPVWIVLEYLSAESWVPAHHGLPSPHPTLALERYFFFPGFSAQTGGLLRERDLLARRDAYGADDRARLWERLGHTPPPPDALTVFVLGYGTAPLCDLFGAWAAGERPIVAVVPEVGLADQARRFLGDDRCSKRGSLEIRFMPFVPQARFDELLWTCDINFVRGEDSIVRAQWAAKPFVWHIYVQEGEAHRAKLEALLDVYGAGLDEAAAQAMRGLCFAWNQLDGARVSAACAWAAFEQSLPVLAQHGRMWAERLAANGELASNLARFCRDKLK
jgi:uncharacterized repeat protein (TIGR03837 family)